MDGSWPTNQGINPEPIIDLRPKKQRLRSAWRDLTTVRLVVLIGRLGWRAFVVIINFLYQLLRGIGLAIVDSIFWLKTTTVNIKYKRRERILRRRADFNFVSETIKRVGQGVQREISSVAVKRSTWPKSWPFKIANFILLLCLVAAPFLLYNAWRSAAPLRASVTNTIEAAFNNLFSAKDLAEKQDFPGAGKAFEQASVNFLKAQSDLSFINQTLLDLAGIIPDKKFKLASESRRLLVAGQLSARIGAELALAAEPTENATVISFLERFAAYAGPASEDARTLSNELKKININNLPEDYQEEFTKLREQAELLAPSLQEATALAQQAASFLGKQMDKRYLLVFQNNSEKRASGGFMGSFALVDMSRGEIKNITVPEGGTYDTEAGLYEKIIAPEPLWLVNPLWHFWDSNWWPDWPMSAKKIEWFYEKSNGPTVDGVIGITPTVMEKLLKITGPIDMTENYDEIITADNFWQVTQTFSEQKPQVTVEPKKIIGDLTTKLMEEIPKNITPEKVFALINLFEESLSEKQILIYLNDPVLEKSVKNFGWDGAIKETAGDYIMVVNSNIGGQKSDRAIIESINHDAQILPDGTITVILTIRRTHTAVKNEPFVGFRNVDWLRVYVPEGSELISANGFQFPDQSYFEDPQVSWQKDPDLANEADAKTDPASGTKIYKEAGKTVFANWSMVDPGKTTTLQFRYRLPFKFNRRTEKNWFDMIKSYFETEPTYRYSLLAQKQPGSLTSSISSSLSVADGWQALWHYPESLETTKTGWTFDAPLKTDVYATTLFYKSK